MVQEGFRSVAMIHHPCFDGWQFDCSPMELLKRIESKGKFEVYRWFGSMHRSGMFRRKGAKRWTIVSVYEKTGKAVIWRKR